MRVTVVICCTLLAAITPAFAQASGASAGNTAQPSGTPSTSAAGGVIGTPGSNLSEYNRLSDLDGIPTVGTPKGLPAHATPRQDASLGSAQSGIWGPGAPGTTVP